MFLLLQARGRGQWFVVSYANIFTCVMSQIPQYKIKLLLELFEYIFVGVFFLNNESYETCRILL